MKKIIFLLLPALCLFAAFRNEKNITITGTVTDESGRPIEAVSVTAGHKATNTYANGRYIITIPDSEKSLKFSGTGLTAQNIPINNRTVIDVVMTQSSSELNTVVVTALGRTTNSEQLNFASSTQDKSMFTTGYLSSSVAGTVSGLQMNGSGTYSSGSGNSDDDESNTEAYNNIVENDFRKVLDEPVSTFSIDVDAASYSNVRRYLNMNQLPPAGSVRTEELINYFKYQYPQPTGKDPFSINTEISSCPWNKDHKLVLIGLQGKNIPVENLPASNLVFLIDVSGSMSDENKLPLVQASLKLLTDQLREKDKISIVVYAGNAGVVLPATSGADKIKIKRAIDNLEAGGSTAGGEGIKLAYKIAQQNLIKSGNNRIILCTDGDFNVGVSSDAEMIKLVEGERNKGIFLTVLGYGMGN